MESLHRKLVFSADANHLRDSIQFSPTLEIGCDSGVALLHIFKRGFPSLKPPSQLLFLNPLPCMVWDGSADTALSSF